MDEILKKVDAAFQLISSIPVSGDNVDIVAAARNNLRAVYAELKKLDKEGLDNG
jgi:hypothetical protein